MEFTAAELALEPQLIMHGDPAVTQRNWEIYFKDGLLLGETGVWDGATVERQARDGATGNVCTPLL